MGIGFLTVATAGHVWLVNWTHTDLTGESMVLQDENRTLLVWRTYEAFPEDIIRAEISTSLPTWTTSGATVSFRGEFYVMEGGDAHRMLAGQEISVYVRSSQQFSLDFERPPWPTPRLPDAPGWGDLDLVWVFDRDSAPYDTSYDDFASQRQAREVYALVHADTPWGPRVVDEIQPPLSRALYVVQGLAAGLMVAGLAGWLAVRRRAPSHADRMASLHALLHALRDLMVGVMVVFGSLIAVILLNPDLIQGSIGFHAMPSGDWPFTMAAAWVAAMLGGLVYAGMHLLTVRAILREWERPPAWLDETS